MTSLDELKRQYEAEGWIVVFAIPILTRHKHSGQSTKIEGWQLGLRKKG